jgi:rare lipoprotein A
MAFGSRLMLMASLTALLLATGCGRRKVKVAQAPRIGATETGIASWYGHPYHGRRAANGEIYDMNELTAAHRTLPFETWVSVLNLANGKKVEVRIQDRGPFIDGRIIDLSRAAAERIEMIGPGISKVRLTIIHPPKEYARQPDVFAVQVGAFRDKARAEALARSMEKYGPVQLVERRGEGVVWRVLAGRASSQAEAQELADRIGRDGRQAFVVRLDSPAPAQ